MLQFPIPGVLINEMLFLTYIFMGEFFLFPSLLPVNCNFILDLSQVTVTTAICGQSVIDTYINLWDTT